MTVSGTETTHEVVENTQDEDFLLNIVHVVQRLVVRRQPRLSTVI